MEEIRSSLVGGRLGIVYNLELSVTPVGDFAQDWTAGTVRVPRMLTFSAGRRDHSVVTLLEKLDNRTASSSVLLFACGVLQIEGYAVN